MIASIILLLLFFPLVYFKGADGDGYTKENLISYRGILALMIVIDHVSQEMYSPGLMFPFQYMGYVVVAIFFFISGYGLEISSSNSDRYLEEFWIKRLPKICIPFWISNFVYVVVDLVIYKTPLNILDIVLYIIGVKLINKTAWYVLALLILYLSFYIGKKYLQKYELLYHLVFFVVYTIGARLIADDVSLWIQSIPAFFIGVYVYRYNKKFEKIIEEKRYICLFFCATIALIIARWNISGWKYQIILAWLSSILVAFTFYFIVNKVSSAPKGMFYHLGLLSYEIYLTHNLFRFLFKGEYFLPESELANKTICGEFLIKNDGLYFLTCLCLSFLMAFLINKVSEAIISKVLYKKI